MPAIGVFPVKREYLACCLRLMVLVNENKSWPQDMCHVKVLVASDLCMFCLLSSILLSDGGDNAFMTNCIDKEFGRIWRELYEKGS
jgi:hypothetical protein